MPLATITCQQAIFTSIRTPTGEGYRIVAASRGLRPDEKQSITRSSPSHDSLCIVKSDSTDPPQPRGLAFYPLPGGRLCAAVSCYAGVEHTGRGGQRVYTFNAVFESDQFARLHFNPFVIFRALADAGLTEPQLNPPPVLPELNVEIAEKALSVPGVRADEVLHPTWRTYLLQCLLEERNVILNVPAGWHEAAELLLLGIPGPMRADISFGAGIRFSISRCHRLSLLKDDHRVIRNRIIGQPLQLINPAEGQPPEKPASAWFTFVERHWRSGKNDVLARRTSRAFQDVRAGARERIARAFNDLDACDRLDTEQLLRIAVDQIQSPQGGPESEIAAELLLTVQQLLMERFRAMSWSEAGDLWPALCSLWRRSKEGCLFAFPLIEQALDAAARVHPAIAAEAALELVRIVPPGADDALCNAQRSSLFRRAQPVDRSSDKTAQPGHPVQDLVDRALSKLADWAEQADDDDIDAITPLYHRWQLVRPQCSILERLHPRCSATD